MAPQPPPRSERPGGAVALLYIAISPAAALLMIVAVVMAVGCAREQWVYEKSKTTAVRMEEDMAACRKESLSPYKIVIVPSDRIDRDVFNRCMERRGYTVRRERP